MELSSAQRQLEADLARATRLANTAEAELREALEHLDEAAFATELMEANRARKSYGCAAGWHGGRGRSRWQLSTVDDWLKAGAGSGGEAAGDC